MTVIFILIFSNCKDKFNHKDYQRRVIEENLNLETDLSFEYYKDSIIKEVSEIENGRKHGRTIQFSSEGLIKRIYFVNSDHEIVGDESIFDELGILSEHFFKLDSERLLFYAKFSPQGKFEYSEGNPRYLHGRSEGFVGDTLSFYIATPIIPGFQTNVSFFEKNIKSSRVDYLNDIRQLNYKIIVPSDTKKLQFCLKIEIKDSLNNIIIEDLDDDINVEVKPQLVRASLNNR